MKKVIIISIVVHSIFLALFAPYLKSKMHFDEKEEAQRTEEVRKRELARQEYEKIKREKQKLDEKTARQLKKEAERKKRENMVKQTEELKKLRDEMLERQEKALAQLHQRKKEDIITAEARTFEKEAEKIKNLARAMTASADRKSFCLAGLQNSQDLGALGLFDSFQVYQGVLQPPFDVADPLHNFNLDGDVADTVTGKSGKVRRVADFVALPTGGMAFQGDGKRKVDLWPLAVDENFTMVARVKLEPKPAEDSDRYSGFVANTHSDSYNKGFRAYLAPTAPDAKTSTIVLETTGDQIALKTSSLPDAFSFGEWHEVGLVINRSENWAKIYLDGIDVTAPDSKLAKNFPTDPNTIDGTVAEMAENLSQKVEETAPNPENAEDFLKDLAELEQKLEERMEENKDQPAVRDQIKATENAIAEMTASLDALPAKTDMAEMNDTSDSVADKMSPSSDAASAAELYNEAVELEKQIAAAHADITAADKAASENSSYSEARADTPASTPSRPDLASALASQSSATGPQTVGGLNEFRASLAQASSEVGDMTARAKSMLGGSENSALAGSAMMNGNVFASMSAQSRLAASGRYGSVVSMTSFGLGDSEGDSSNLRQDLTGEGMAMAAGKKQPSITLDEEDIISKALPGRRFTAESTRRGWLYLDTWYVIGPWENNSEVNFEKSHQPEYAIDFDANYYDGKFAKRDGHPDQILKWEFYQSDSVRCQPPRVYGAASYYAYTEVWFEQAREMLIAVASDDASAMWLNGGIIWEDSGQSPWKLGEGYRRVNMRQGYNTLLVRIENGPAHCVWSVLLCPPEVMNK